MEPPCITGFAVYLFLTIVCFATAWGQTIDCACNGDFQVGDRVEAVANVSDNNNIMVGDMGTVVCGNGSSPPPLLIRWDNDVSGHDGNNNCECGTLSGTDAPHGWYVECSEIALVGESHSESVDVCHIPPGNPANAHTITINEKALSKHLAHGDNIGACGDR